MFGKSTTDVSRTLTAMIDQAIVDCRHDQRAAINKTAEYIRQDRRFDKIDAVALAKDAFDARHHGRQINLSNPGQTEHTGAQVGWTSRSV